MIEQALKLAAIGFKVFPVHYPKGEGCSCGDPDCRSVGKHPILGGWKQVATASPDEVAHLWGRFPNANIGIRAGEGLIVVDIDDEASESYKEIERLLVPTFTVKTGKSAGRHLYYHCYAGEGKLVCQMGGVDIRGEGGYVVGPGSLHRSGARYQAVDLDQPVAAMPVALYDYIEKRRRKLSASASPKAVREGVHVTEGGVVPEGEGVRHNFLLAKIYRMSGTMTKKEMYAYVNQVLLNEVEGAMPQDEVNNLIEGAYRRRREYTFPDERATAEAAAVMLRGRAVRVETGEWFIRGDDNLWRACTSVPYSYIWAANDALWDNIPMGDAPKDVIIESKKVRREARKAQFAEAVARSLADDLAVKAEDFQMRGNGLPFSNGYYDLDTGTLRPFDGDDYVTEAMKVAFDPDAQCPRWEDTIAMVSGGDVDTMRYYQQVFGFLISAKTQRAIFMFVGPKASGKTTLVSTLRGILGPRLAGTAQHGLIQRGEGGDEQHARTLAALYGRRFVYIDETKQGAKIDTAKLKAISSTGARLRGRLLHKNAFEFVNTAKIVVMTNFQPQIDADDDAAWSRIKLVPFLQSLPEGKQDPDFQDKLTEEAAGILNWCIAGYRDLAENGWQKPPQVDVDVAAWRAEGDPVAEFVDEQVTFDRETRTRPMQIWTAFQAWAASNKLSKEELPGTSKAFLAAFTRQFGAQIEHGGRVIRVGDKKVMVGVKLKGV